MIIYAESSAVLAWLLGEPRAALTERALRDASTVVTSTLTSAECSRAIVRGAALGAINRARAQALVRTLGEWDAGCDRLEIGDRVLARASAPFPCEPIRTLDAIHVASAALLQAELGAVTMLSYVDRVRANAAALGMSVLPPDGP